MPDSHSTARPSQIKHTIDSLRSIFADHGCELLESVYRGASHPMKYRCRCGEVATKSMSNVRKGIRCGRCAGKAKSTSQLRTLSEAREIASANGCEFVSETYSRSQDSHQFRCRCGGVFSATFNRLLKGQNLCSGCRAADVQSRPKIKRGPSKKRLDLAVVAKIFSDQGCKLTETSYIGKHIPLSYICSCGTLSKAMLSNFRKGGRCEKCRIKKISLANKKYTIEDAKSLFSKHGCTLLESEFFNSRTPMRFVCKCGRKSRISFSKFLSRYDKEGGYDCELHAGLRSGSSRGEAEKIRDYDFVKRFFSDRNCTLISDSYVSCKEKLKYICECGRESVISFTHFRIGHRCRDCSIEKRSGEKCFNWIPDREQHKLSLTFRSRCRSALANTLKATGKRKQEKAYAMLGYNADQLRHWITNHPNWESVKNSRWALDHIFPIVAFLHYGLTDTKLINCLDNLQPLSFSENSVKNGNYDPAEFEAWLTNRGVAFVRPGDDPVTIMNPSGLAPSPIN